MEKELLFLVEVTKHGQRSNADLGMSSYGLHKKIFSFLKDLEKELPECEISLGRNTFENLPVSDILDIKRPNINNLRDEVNIIEDNPIKKRKNKKRRRKPETVLEPSKYEPLIQWSNSKYINKWSYINFLGYYFYKYRECVGFEDPNFVGSVWTISGKRKGQLNDFMKASKTIQGFLNFLESLGKDKEEAKEYMDWVFDKFVPNNKWYKFPPVFWKVFESKGFLWVEYSKTKQSKVSKGTSSKWNPHG